MRPIAYLLLPAMFVFLFSGCITRKKLETLCYTHPPVFDIRTFNAEYANTDSLGSDLWFLLSKCADFKAPLLPTSPDCRIKMVYDNKRTLEVMLLENSMVVDRRVFKVQKLGQHLVLKRNLHVIPIPMVWTIVKESRAQLGNDDKGRLQLQFRMNDFVMIFVSASAVVRHSATFARR